MSKTNKRVPRSTKNLSKEFAQTPVDITKIGTDEDPCFGKQYEPVTEECSGCGDSELCAIVHMHHLDGVRKKTEKKSRFKDRESAARSNTEIDSGKLSRVIEKKVKSKGKLKVSSIIKGIKRKYDPDDLLAPGRVNELCKYAIKMNKKLKVKKDGKGKLYVRYVG